MSLISTIFSIRKKLQVGYSSSVESYNEDSSTVDSYIDDYLEESQDYLTKLSSEKQYKFVSGYYTTPSYSKDIFLNDISSYINIELKNVSKKVNDILVYELKDFCEGKEFININEFTNDFYSHLKDKKISDLSTEELIELFDSAITFSVQGEQIANFLSATNIYRVLRNEVLQTTIKIQSEISKSTPLKFCFLEFFDLLFSLKKGSIVFRENLFNTNLFKMKKNYEKKLCRINVVSNINKRNLRFI